VSKYRTWVDNRAALERAKMRLQTPNDLCSGTMRLALHLSDREAEYLEHHNPETLGRHDDEQLRSKYWAEFIAHPASIPYRVNKV
jgi:hypothetical protein